jgi:hypothetical protein
MGHLIGDPRFPICAKTALHYSSLSSLFSLKLLGPSVFQFHPLTNDPSQQTSVSLFLSHPGSQQHRVHIPIKTSFAKRIPHRGLIFFAADFVLATHFLFVGLCDSSFFSQQHNADSGTVQPQTNSSLRSLTHARTNYCGKGVCVCCVVSSFFFCERAK